MNERPTYTEGHTTGPPEPSGRFGRAVPAPAAITPQVRAGLDGLLHHLATADNLTTVLDEVRNERTRQNAQWGPQHHPDGTGTPGLRKAAEHARNACQQATTNGAVTWKDILTEEVFEALAETERARIRAELVQVAAVAVCWIQDIDHQQQEGGTDGD